jgi:hypothetical protein
MKGEKFASRKTCCFDKVMVSGISIVVEHLYTKPKIKGLNLVVTRHQAKILKQIMF